MADVIYDIEVYPLVTHTDERGFFQEVIRIKNLKPGFGQWSHSMMIQGVIKAWHIHQIQYDYWYVPIGLVKAVLADTRQNSPTHGSINEFLLGDYQQPLVLKIPPGVAHGCKVLQGPAHLFYITSEIYNPDDEGRIAYDDPDIGYDWLEGPEIK